MEIAERLCDRVGIIHQGELAALGTLSELKQGTAIEGSTLEDVFLKLTGDFDADTKKLLEELGT
jgi:ABC-2 type transport system ATP-binding protein